MNKHKAKRPYMASMIGTALEYYDSSLYGFMAPMLTPLFLPNMDPVLALVMAYAMYPLGMLTRPLGAYLIGKIGDKQGRRQALKVSIVGTAVVTGLMGFIPTYETLGIFAPITLALLRLAQKFFNGGEYNGGAIFALEHLKKGKGFRSGMYCAFTVAGILAASAVVAVVSHLPEGSWRYAYFLAFLTALFGFYLRKRIPESPEFEEVTSNEKEEPFLEKLKKHKRVVLWSFGSAGFFAVLYMIPSVFMIGYLPLVTDIKSSTVLIMNTICLFIYLLALLGGGWLGDRLGFKQSMKLAIIVTMVLAYPLLLMINTNSVLWVFVMKAIFAILCGWYVGPFHAWVQELFSVNTRYQFISITYSLGSQLGSIMPAASLWVWKLTKNAQAPAFFIILWGIFGVLAVSKARPVRVE